MRTILWVTLLLASAVAVAADKAELQDRRRRAAAAFPDGILLLHAESTFAVTADGFRQNPAFYYFTGLEDAMGAFFALDSRSHQSWLFRVSNPPFSKMLPPEANLGPDLATQFGIDHVADWSELESFLAHRTTSPATLYYVEERWKLDDLPANLSGAGAGAAPLWAVTIAKKWPSLQLKEVGDRVYDLMAVQSPSEIVALRAATKATVAAVLAGMRATKPSVSQRSVEAAVENACWSAGAHGSSFWPWAMAGQNAVFPRPFASLTRYDHLNAVLQPGELVRLDVGCEVDHYQGDLGRTIPVSGRYSDDQREIWNIFVAAYQAGVKMLRDGTTKDQVFEAWSADLLRSRASARSALARQAIDQWSKRENVPFWQLHTMNLDAGAVEGPLRAGTTIAFEPIASIDGQGFYLEDMFLIGEDGAELLTPGVPYGAAEIEAAMQ